MPSAATVNVDLTRSPHPFPARMAASIPIGALRKTRKSLRILDPMAGSGTCAVVARASKHLALAFDTDPLAVMLTNVRCGDLNQEQIRTYGQQVLSSARQTKVAGKDAFPMRADEETRRFARYWFDLNARKQLAALSRQISRIRAKSVRDVLWCAMSRLIITKDAGVSLARDVSHSRPHKTYRIAPLKPFDHFERALERVLASCPFSVRSAKLPKAVARLGDARKLPLNTASVDVVITSPPYLNAIDYMRGHKLSLIWMGYRVSELRAIRRKSVGAELAAADVKPGMTVILKKMGRIHLLPSRVQKMIALYLNDMNAVLTEIARVLTPNGKAVIIVGDSNLRGVFIRNSVAVRELAEQNGLVLVNMSRRRIPSDKRYLPPPRMQLGQALGKRMRTEVVLSFKNRITE